MAKNKMKLSRALTLENVIDQCGPKRVPDFFGIGTEKAGTTWLWRMFQKHPNIGVPVRKELRYFTDLNIKPISSPNKKAAIANFGTFNSLAQILSNTSSVSINNTFLEHLAIDIRLLRNTDASYLGIFGQMTEAVVGEISPQYCTVSLRKIGQMHALAPQAKIIFLIRDPVDRAISGAKMKAFEENPKVTEEAILAHAFQYQQLNLSKYTKKIARFESFFAGNVFVGFFDEIATAPLELLSKICKFLGVPYDPVFFCNRR